MNKLQLLVAAIIVGAIAYFVQSRRPKPTKPTLETKPTLPTKPVVNLTTDPVSAAPADAAA